MIPNLNNLDITKSPSAVQDPSGMPGVLPSTAQAVGAYDSMRVRYGRFDLNEMVDISELEKIETRAIRGQGVYILSRKDFVFMDKIFMLISYLEEEKTAEKPSLESSVKKIERKGGTTEPLSFAPPVNPTPLTPGPTPAAFSPSVPTSPTSPTLPASVAPWDDVPAVAAVAPTVSTVSVVTPEQALEQALTSASTSASKNYTF